jgi:hypothetical protein
MESRFNADEWRKLGAVERVRQCRLMAVQARSLASDCGPELARSYIRIADDWERLATEIDKTETETVGRRVLSS